MHFVWRSLAVVLATVGIGGLAAAQQYPTKPIRIVIGFPPGTILDASARLVGNEMEKRLGQPIVLEFKPGANGTIGARSVAASSPDGYTLFYGNALTIHPIFNRNNALDAATEFAPVSNFATTPYFVFSSAKSRVGSFQELLAFAKANPDVLKNGVPAAPSELIMQMLKSRAGISYRNIPYKAASQTILALLSGEIDLAASAAQPVLPHIRSGAVRALFVASARRSSVLPDVPTAAEVGMPNFEFAVNLGLWAPAGTPRAITQRVSAEAAAALKTPSVAEQIKAALAAEPVGSTPEEQRRTFDSDTKFWSEAARVANFQPQ